MATRISGTGSTSGPDWASAASATSDVQGIDVLQRSGAAASAPSIDGPVAGGSLPGLEDVLKTMAHQVQEGEFAPQTDLTRVAIDRMIQARMPNLPANEQAARADELHALLSTDASFQALLSRALRTEP
jgi:hypothetical protein